MALYPFYAEEIVNYMLVLKLALVASFLSSKIKRIFYLERGKNG